MKPVEQTRLAPPLGNCWAACLASILEVEIEAVPWQTEEEGSGGLDGWLHYRQRIQNDFLRPRNLQLLCFPADGEYKPDGFAILAADSPRCGYYHAVVCEDGRIVHDPHPEREMGVGVWREWEVFTILDPSKLSP